MKAKEHNEGNENQEEQNSSNFQEKAENSINTEGSETNEDSSALSEVEIKEAELIALNDKYTRLYSEFDNFKRRTQKEKIALYKTASEDVFQTLLPVMDDFERAKQSMEESNDYDGLKSGVDLIFNKLLSTFKANGVTQIESSVGKDFDLDLHEAIAQVPAPEKKLKNKVIDEVQKGYILNDKVIRHAKVVVGK